ncbi:YbaN family protein [Parvularcula sp. ZS-1/3]|uniref:YbaN family protein n=1 Tax=Parvularcula mediterranea TaxID=2732508 RepID=A0A7Y3W5C6_9PROT|nr:YbaN family protein [Parvularcula mediterranea]NNU16162.1 YbaN family protein [Parvularcula mediterranea]
MVDVMKRSSKLFWRALGYACLAIGAAGILLPLLPTTGPWILAVVFLIKGEDPMASKLLDHPRFGAPIRAWFERGEISRSGKIAASVGMALAVVSAAFLGMPPVAVGVMAVVLLGVALWLCRRPEPGQAARSASPRR